jgi:hypothetical protein
MAAYSLEVWLLHRVRKISGPVPEVHNGRWTALDEA